MKERGDSQQDYARLYAEIELWLNVACGGLVPENSSLHRKDMTADSQEAFIRGAAYGWAQRQHLAIRQVLVWPPDEESYSEWDLNGLCEQAEAVLQHLYTDVVVDIPEVLEASSASLTTSELVAVLNRSDRRAIPVSVAHRRALAKEAFIQEKLAKGRVMYFRDPKTGKFYEVEKPDDEPTEPDSPPDH